MSFALEPPGPGGFYQPTLSSPPPSSAHSVSTAQRLLPQPRSTPLKPGSPKESSFIDYVDRKLLAVSRRYEKRFINDIEDEGQSGKGRGYEDFGELAKDLEGVIDIIWVSGTPSLQTPYLLTIALTACTDLASFSFQPRPTFQLLYKLDLALYSLLQGRNAESDEMLPSFKGGRGKPSTTEKVRMRGLVERTRVAVVEVAGKGASVTDAGRPSKTDDNFTTDVDDDDDDAMEGLQIEENHGRWEMEIARVYEKTIVELGMELETSGTGSLGHSTSVQLSVANLVKATTQNPQPRQCSASTASIKHIDLEFAKASKDGTLAETALLGDDGRHLRFLGDHEDMPFFMVRAGKDFFNSNDTEKTTKRPARSMRTQMSDSITLYDSGVDEVEEAYLSRAINAKKQANPPVEPHALCLIVFLSKASFSQTICKDRMKMDVKHDIKIDVYFNGQFFDSKIMGVGQLHCAGPRGIKVRMHRFTGQKLSRFIEKPWVFVPPCQQPDGSLRASSPKNASILENLGEDAGANGRWTAIADGLLKEANKAGRDMHGERPITGEYLESLASLPAPPELKDVQKAGDTNFGVIDVVVIWGKGQKDAAGSKYLTEPTRLRLNGYTAESDVGEASEGVQVQNKNVQAAVPNPNSVSVSDALSRPIPQLDGIPTTVLTSTLDAAPTATPAPPPNPAPKTRAEALATAVMLDGSEYKAPKPVNPVVNEVYPTPRSRQRTVSTSTTRQDSASSTRRTTPKRYYETSISSETANPSKRQRMPYYHVITTKQTYAEEMKSIVEQAVEEAEMLTTRRTLTNMEAEAETVNSPPLISAPEEVSLVEIPQPSKIVTLKLSPPLKAGVSANDRFTTQRQHRTIPPISPSLAAETPTKAHTPREQGPSLISPSADDTPAESTPASSLRRSWPHKADMIPSFDADFVLPELSEECCVTFAERGVVRSVGAIRGGWFEEKGVLMGTRFLVG